MISWGDLFVILGAQAIGLILGYSIAYFVQKVIIKYVEKKANKKSKILGEQTDKAKGKTVR